MFNKDDLVIINISGTVFKCHKSTLTTFEDSVLASLDKTSDNYDVSTGEYFFDRNPDYFNGILDAYRHGTIHIPKWACGVSFQKELEFWGLRSQYVSPCCWGTLYSAEEDLETVSNLEQYYRSNTGVELMIGDTISLRNRIWLFLYEPYFSVYAKFWAAFISLVIVISVLVTAIESLPLAYTETYTEAEAKNVQKMLQILGWENITHINSIMKFKPSSVLPAADCTCFAILTIEMILGVIVCPKMTILIKSWVHISELICTISFWIYFTLERCLGQIESTFLLHICLILKYVTALKLVRLFRVANSIFALKIMGLTLCKAKKQIFALIAVLFILASFFGMIIFIFEFSHTDRKIENIFSAMYWAVITLTTVGYGDYTPVTAGGQVLAGMCSLFGILMLAIPIGIVASDYHKFYDYHTYAKKYVIENTTILNRGKMKTPEKLNKLYRNDSLFKFKKDNSQDTEAFL